MDALFCLYIIIVVAVFVRDEFKDENPEGTPITYFGKTYLRTSEVKNCFRVGFSLQPEFIIGKLTAGIHDPRGIE